MNRSQGLEAVCGSCANLPASCEIGQVPVSEVAGADMVCADLG
jgi:hypothetical protein